jgi:hypothetical protein
MTLYVQIVGEEKPREFENFTLDYITDKEQGGPTVTIFYPAGKEPEILAIPGIYSMKVR